VKLHERTQTAMPRDEQPGVVSVVSPCFNVERYIERFVASLVAQTYKRLEIILVNDGSTDRTGELISASIPLLENQGYAVTLVEQRNAGLAGAINAGLQRVSGEFVTWPDPDDWLTPDSIAERVNLLRRFPTAGLVRSSAHFYIEAKNTITGAVLDPDGSVRLIDDFFETLFYHRTGFYPICHFARSSMLWATTGRSIFTSPTASQNIQMLLPLTQSHPTVLVHRNLGYYTIRENSRSREARTASKLLARYRMMQENTLETIRVLRGDRDRLRYLANQFFLRNRLLPAAYEGGMCGEATAMLGDCDLPPIRKRCARALLATRPLLPAAAAPLTFPGGTPAAMSRLFRKTVSFRAPPLPAEFRVAPDAP